MAGRFRRAITDRWHVLYRVYWRPLVAVAVAVYAVIGLDSTLSGEFASARVQKAIRLGNLIPHLSPWAWAAIGLGLLLVLGVEGATREFRHLDKAHEEKRAEDRAAHERALEAERRSHQEEVTALRRAVQAAPVPAVTSGLDVAIKDEHTTPFPGSGLILEIEYEVTNHDPVPHDLFPRLTAEHGAAYFSMSDDPEHERFRLEYAAIERRRERDRLPRRVQASETVRGVYVMDFAWNPNPSHRLPDYTLIVGDGRREYEARPCGLSGRAAPPAAEALQPCYDESPVYRHRIGNMTEHRIGLRNPAGNPEATGVRLEWTEMTPRPRFQSVHWERWQPVIPSAVPRVAGGDPAIGTSLPAGQEDVWVAVSTATTHDGIMNAVEFGPEYGSSRGNWHGLLWNLESGGRWRLTYRAVADNLPAATFSLVMTAEDGQIQCELEG